MCIPDNEIAQTMKEKKLFIKNTSKIEKKLKWNCKDENFERNT